jgi:hypothetical protein
MAKLEANALIRARIDEDTKALLERAARAEDLSLSAWMRLHLIRIAEESWHGAGASPPDTLHDGQLSRGQECELPNCLADTSPLSCWVPLQCAFASFNR